MSLAEEIGNLVGKLHEIEEQANFALSELPQGLTHSRMHHILSLARFIRLQVGRLPLAN